MKKRALLIALLLIAAVPAFAAIQYEFRQSVRSEVQSVQSSDTSGIGLIDGDRSRIEYREGSAAPGTYLLTDPLQDMLFVVDPKQKSYIAVDLNSALTSIGQGKIEITDFKKSLVKLEDHPTIAGYPTDHYRLVTSYDAAMVIGELKIKQGVVTTIDKWTTSAFGDVAEMMLATGAGRTGDPSIDQLIDAETTAVKGFTLRQLTTIVTTIKDLPRQARSVVKVQPTRKQSSEFLVTSAKIVNAEPSLFKVPPGYRKVDQDHATAAVNLNLQPAQ
ncbi:MAG: DUF4412 domain-containing protein [Thermoanaerobaculia bacterium]